MYLKSKLIQGEKRTTITNYSKGFVTIQTKTLQLIEIVLKKGQNYLTLIIF